MRLSTSSNSHDVRMAKVVLKQKCASSYNKSTFKMEK